MLYLCAATVGVMSYYMADRKYRTAFLEARQSLEVKLTLEEQSTQQVNGTHTRINNHMYTLLNEIILFLFFYLGHTHTYTFCMYKYTCEVEHPVLPNYSVFCSAQN